MEQRLNSVSEDAPKITADSIHCIRNTDPGQWSCSWRIQNLTDRSMNLLSVRLPHGQFRSQEREFNPSLEVLPGASSGIETSVLCDEEPGAVIENAFLILLCEWQEERWRIFVRVRVTINQEGEPAPVTELITTQRVGFSGLS
jgi:hypothetical protein